MYGKPFAPTNIVDPGATKALPTNVRWLSVAPTLLMIWIIGMFDKSNISIVIADPKFLADMHLGHKPALLGWLITGMIIAYGAGSPIWGWLVGKIGPRVAAAVSLVLWALICVFSGIATNYGMLLGARIVLGVAEASLYPITLALVASWFPLAERGRATAFWWIGTMIGPMFTGLLITWLIVHFGWRVQFYTLGAMALLLPLPMVWLLVRDTPQVHRGVNQAEFAKIKAGSIEADDNAPGRILRTKVTHWSTNHRFWLVVVAILFNSIFFWGWSLWLPTYLKVVHHFSFARAGYLTFVFYGAATATILVVGRFSDRFFRRAPFAGAGWFLAGVCFLGATYSANATICIVLMTLSLCFQQIGVSCGQMLYHSVVGTTDMAKSQGIATAVVQILGSFSPVMIGMFLKATPGDFTLGFVILAGAVLVSAGCMATLAREGL
jgi:sugar phosphate permease